MKFSIFFAALATLAFAAPGPSMEGEGLEKRQRSCTINAPVCNTCAEGCRCISTSPSVCGCHCL
uniref:EC40 protein n=1 Tax=Colletotrichum higginsianum TaxID=80884 RepID=I2G7B9_9PEZI|nr:EC40 protein [Colletotrichum higginsianum]